MRPKTSAVVSVVVVAALSGWSCRDKGSSAEVPTADALGVLGPGSVGMTSAISGPTGPVASPSPSPSPAPSPVLEVPGGIAGGATCAAGKGTLGATCSRSALGRFFPQVDAALEQVIKARPELFDLTRKVGENGYLVRDIEGVYQAVALQLQAARLCAHYDFEHLLLQVKEGDESSEDYDLVLSNGHLRRGEGSYRSTCTPAAFPLTPQDVIDDIRVAFYSIECSDGAPPPRNGEGKLRMECTGIVTATPKKADNTDVPERIHGSDITWHLDQVDDYVDVREFPGQPFNKYVKGLDPGGFRLCATVQGIEGCLNGQVLEK